MEIQEITDKLNKLYWTSPQDYIRMGTWQKVRMDKG